MSARSTSATSRASRQQSASLRSDAPFVPDPRDIQDDDFDTSSLAPRRKARAIALGVLYELDVVRHAIEECLAWSMEVDKTPEETLHFARELVEGVLANRDQLDKQIQELAPAWPVSQLSPIDRNLLRLAIYEVTVATGTPPKAAINEAVELAKLYGSEGSPRFINGVLGSIMDRIKR